MSSISKGLFFGSLLLSSTLSTNASEGTYPTIEKVKIEVARALGKTDLSQNRTIEISIEKYCRGINPQSSCELENITIASSLPGHISMIYETGKSQYETHPQFPKEEIKNVNFGKLHF